MKWKRTKKGLGGGEPKQVDGNGKLEAKGKEKFQNQVRAVLFAMVSTLQGIARQGTHWPWKTFERSSILCRRDPGIKNSWYLD